jgi:hypothetical protein
VSEAAFGFVDVGGEVAGELGGPLAGLGCMVIPGICTRRFWYSMANAMYRRVSVTAQSR